MYDRLNHFVHTENIAMFLAQLRIETDPIKLKLLIALLREERANQPPYLDKPAS